jgi:hypothetical protein
MTNHIYRCLAGSKSCAVVGGSPVLPRNILLFGANGDQHLDCIYGTFHNISEAHLHRYLAEFDFPAQTRDLDDAERPALWFASAQGKRLLYRQPNQAKNMRLMFTAGLPR